MEHKTSKVLLVMAAGCLIFGLAVVGGRLTGKEEAEEIQTSADSTAVGIVHSISPENPLKGTVLRAGYGGFDDKFNPYYAERTGDLDVVRLTQVNLLTLDRSGQVVSHGIEGETIPYNGTDYHYQGISDIDVSYEPESGQSVYSIRLKENVSFSDGTPMTIDDVIFNYYLYLSEIDGGSTELKNCPIVGLMNYEYNSSLAESMTVSPEEIDAALQAPNETMAAYIRTLIADVLHEEKKQCETIWQNYQELGFGNSAQEFFFNLYGIDKNYNPLDKDLDTVCEDVIQSYGLDYRRLAEHYAVDAGYFDERVNNFVSEELLKIKLQENPGEPVDYISGISRTGDYTMEIRVYGYDSELIYELCNLYIAPMHYYGDAALYNYENHQFGFVRNGWTLDGEKAVHPVGAGAFVFADYAEGSIYLDKNEYYFPGNPKLDHIVMKTLDGSLVEAIRQGDIDVGELRSTKDSYELIRSSNTEGEISGDVIYTQQYADAGYSYIGINADQVKAGIDGNSEASMNLRRGLAVLIAAYREDAYTEYFGKAADILQYPISEASWASPTAESEGFREAYSTGISGNNLYEGITDPAQKEQAALNACCEYLRAAGYIWGDSENAFVSAPEGASLSYEVLLYNPEHDNPSYQMLNKVKNVLASIGITLNIKEAETQQEIWVALKNGEAQIWCASWNMGADPEYASHYASYNIEGGTGYNFYHLRDAQLDELLQQIQNCTTREEKLPLYRQCMERIEAQAVEIPCYQRQVMLLYSSKSVDPNTTVKDAGTFCDWINEIYLLEMK